MDMLFGTPVSDLVYRTTPSKKLRTMSLEEITIDDLVREYMFEIDMTDYKANTPISTGAVFIKGDSNTSVLKASVLKNGFPINISGCNITANIKENMNDTATIECQILDASIGLIQIDIPSIYADEQGENYFEIVLQKGNKILVSQTYSYTVLDSIGEGVVGSEGQMTALQSLIEQVQECKNTVDTITEELEINQGDIDEILEMVGGLDV